MDKVAFEKLIDSLKKFARPELFEDGTDILDELETYLRSNDLILKKCLKERTTLLIGRKGTGKSTLFLKIENEIAKKADQISCFIDTKTIYEHVSNKPFSNENEIDDQILKEYMIKRSFVKYILGEVLDKIEYKIEQSPFERIIKLILDSIVDNKSL